LNGKKSGSKTKWIYYKMITYTLLIRFRGRRPDYIRTGLSLDSALGLKDYFITHVPPAIFGSVAPEKK